MSNYQNLFHKLKKYDDEYYLTGCKIISQSIFGPEIETFKIETLTEDNAFSVLLFVLKKFNDDCMDEVDKKIFQDTWEFNQFKNFSNIIKFFTSFPKNKIEITQSQFEYFYTHNELSQIKNESHIDFYKYVKENIPQINVDLLFKDLIETINTYSFFQEKESCALQFNKLFLKNLSIDLLNLTIKDLLTYFCSEKNYSYYNHVYKNNDEKHSYINQNDNDINNFSYVFYGNNINKPLINQLFDFILKNYSSIMAINNAEKSYTNFKLNNELNYSLQKNTKSSKI